MGNRPCWLWQEREGTRPTGVTVPIRIDGRQLMTATSSHLARTIPGTELVVFPLSLGGNVFGWTADETTSFEILDAYAAGGGNFIDTADVYSAWAPGHHGGESKTIIGQWMAARRN